MAKDNIIIGGVLLILIACLIYFLLPVVEENITPPQPPENIIYTGNLNLLPPDQIYSEDVIIVREMGETSAKLYNGTTLKFMFSLPMDSTAVMLSSKKVLTAHINQDRLYVRLYSDFSKPYDYKETIVPFEYTYAKMGRRGDIYLQFIPSTAPYFKLFVYGSMRDIFLVAYDVDYLSNTLGIYKTFELTDFQFGNRDTVVVKTPINFSGGQYKMLVTSTGKDLILVRFNDSGFYDYSTVYSEISDLGEKLPSLYVEGNSVWIGLNLQSKIALLVSTNMGYNWYTYSYTVESTDLIPPDRPLVVGKYQERTGIFWISKGEGRNNLMFWNVYQTRKLASFESNAGIILQLIGSNKILIAEGRNRLYSNLKIIEF